MNRQHLAKQTEAEVTVKEPSVSGLCYTVLSHKRIQIGCAVVDVGIVWIGGLEVVRQARKTRVLGGQIEQGDLGSGGLGNRTRRQEFAHRLIELALALFHPLREHQASEGLGNGTDFEDRVRLGSAG